MHENLELRSLFCNSMLTILARVIANDAFKDYRTAKELLNIDSLSEEMHHLRLNEDILDRSFFQVTFIEEIEKINTFSRRLRELNLRTEYL